VHGFDEFFGNLYHLNAEEEPEQADYPIDHPVMQMFMPRGCLIAGHPMTTTPVRTLDSVESAGRSSMTLGR
jgi:hypothetical protein